MNDTLVSCINEKVQQDDVLFHLGDFSWGDKAVRQFRERIICKNIILILGNHDKEIRRQQSLRDLFSEVYDYGYEETINGTHIVFNHYAMRVFNRSHHGSIHFYGHSHGKLPSLGRSMDVGVDTNNFYPYNLLELIEELSKIEVLIVDGHENRNKK
jgi:calcineurin-like phosphoesterase family protein